MSMGNIEGYHQVVPDKIVTKVVGRKAINDYKTKLKALKASGEDIRSGSIDQESKEWLDFKKAYDNICDTFKEKTGLGLYAFYTEGDGDCYDDLESEKWYWVIPESDVWVHLTTKKADEFLKKYGDGAIETNQRFSTYG